MIVSIRDMSGFWWKFTLVICDSLMIYIPVSNVYYEKVFGLVTQITGIVSFRTTSFTCHIAGWWYDDAHDMNSGQSFEISCCTTAKMFLSASSLTVCMNMASFQVPPSLDGWLVHFLSMVVQLDGSHILTESLMILCGACGLLLSRLLLEPATPN